MALIDYDKIENSQNYMLLAWGPATNGGSPDTFEPYKIQRTPYSITIQAVDADAGGAFSGSSPAVALHGSLDGVTYFPLQDLAGSDIALTANGAASAGDVTLYVKPVLTGGDAGTSITVHVLTRFDSL